MINHIEHVLSEFMNAPEFICSFARAVRKHFLADDLLDADSAMFSASDVAAGDALIIYATGAERDFAAARAWCVETLDTFCGHLGVVHVAVMSPFIDAGFVTFYTLGMGPQYDRKHPRWAPHLCLVVVNERHVRAVPVAAREPIRAHMAARAGCIYDADQVWQPARPQPKQPINREAVFRVLNGTPANLKKFFRRRTDNTNWQSAQRK